MRTQRLAAVCPAATAATATATAATATAATAATAATVAVAVADRVVEQLVDNINARVSDKL